MPSRADDRFYGGKRGSSGKAYAAMVAHYGLRKGTQVYHATLNRNKRRAAS